MKTLLLGCGFRRDRLIKPNRSPPCSALIQIEPFECELVTLDANPDCKPDILYDLEKMLLPVPWGAPGGIYNNFDEIHAYEVLEHLGDQGDAPKLLAQFQEFWHLLKPGGFFCATVPWWQGPWAWGDPSHKRVIQPETLSFLSQRAYAEQVGKSPMSDFRDIYSADFEVEWAANLENVTFAFVLRAIKPSRWVEPEKRGSK